jgi:hypothetical protein
MTADKIAEILEYRAKQALIARGRWHIDQMDIDYEVAKALGRLFPDQEQL